MSIRTLHKHIYFADFILFCLFQKLKIQKLIQFFSCFSAHNRPGTELVKVNDTDLFYSVYFYDIAFSDDEINENVNYDSDYDEGLMMSANYPEQSKTSYIVNNSSLSLFCFVFWDYFTLIFLLFFLSRSFFVLNFIFINFLFYLYTFNLLLLLLPFHLLIIIFFRPKALSRKRSRRKNRNDK